MIEKDWNTGDAWSCEQHPEKPFPHDDCIGPGMPDYQGRATITSLTQSLKEAEKKNMVYIYPDSDHEATILNNQHQRIMELTQSLKKAEEEIAFLNRENDVLKELDDPTLFNLIKKTREDQEVLQSENEAKQKLYEENIGIWQRKYSDKLEENEALLSILKEALSDDKFNDHSSGIWQIKAKKAIVAHRKNREGA